MPPYGIRKGPQGHGLRLTQDGRTSPPVIFVDAPQRPGGVELISLRGDVVPAMSAALRKPWLSRILCNSCVAAAGGAEISGGKDLERRCEQAKHPASISLDDSLIVRCGQYNSHREAEVAQTPLGQEKPWQSKRAPRGAGHICRPGSPLPQKGPPNPMFDG